MSFEREVAEGAAPSSEGSNPLRDDGAGARRLVDRNSPEGIAILARAQATLQRLAEKQAAWAAERQQAGGFDLGRYLRQFPQPIGSRR